LTPVFLDQYYTLKAMLFANTTDEQQTIPKHVEDSFDESHNINMDDLDEMEINNNKICQSTENQ
jgi:hypothetical protein